VSTEHDEAQRAHLIFRAMAAAADNAGMSVCVTYADYTDPQRVDVVYVNEGTSRLTGYDLHELSSRSVWAFFAPEEIPRLLDLHARRIRGEDVPAVLETVIVHKDGRRVPVELSTTRVEVGGRPANVSFLFDISYRTNAEEALRRSEARFRTVIENAPDGICILRWPKIVFANPRAARLLGCRTPEQAIGHDIFEFMRPEEAKLATERVTQRMRSDVPPSPNEYTSRDPDGKELLVEISSIPIEYEGAPAVLGFARDVTERKATVARLIEADKLAAVGTLAAGVAHEINNPLAYVLLNLEFLARELPKLTGDASRLPVLQGRLQEALEGADRVKTIVRDLQTFTRRDQGIRGPVDLRSVIETALHLARHEIRHRAVIAKRYDPVPPVYGNTTRLEQLFLNLFLNAAHALADLDPERNLLEIAVRGGDDHSAIAQIRDNGSGMTPDVLRHVFDPFFTTKPTGVGTGLGLPICLGIARAIGGDIRLASEPGRGTTVTVTLPLYRESETQPTDPHPTALAARERLSSPPPRGRVLLIDDERAVAESLALALSEDHDVVTVGSAAEARKRIASGDRFDVVLCDLVMPGESGMQLFEHVRASWPDLARRFAFMTGGAFLPETDRFLQEIDNPRIEKPFDIEAVRSLVDRLLATA
jgi:PAS domain S-box-containing protein